MPAHAALSLTLHLAQCVCVSLLAKCLIIKQRKTTVGRLEKYFASTRLADILTLTWAAQRIPKPYTEHPLCRCSLPPPSPSAATHTFSLLYIAPFFIYFYTQVKQTVDILVLFFSFFLYVNGILGSREREGERAYKTVKVQVGKTRRKAQLKLINSRIDLAYPVTGLSSVQSFKSQSIT